MNAEGIRGRTVAVVGAVTLAITALLVLIAWWLVAPTPRAQPLPPPAIESAGFAPRGQLGVRLPIAQAIDRVLADPSLIGGHP